MVQKYRINIDGKEVTALPGQTILQVARENDIYIPTLCYDERMEIYGACGLCMVEVEGNPKLLKSCATEVAPNMVIRTKSKRIEESRKTNLELLLSNHVGDCRPPCAKECPAGTDCQGYVGLIAEGRYQEALELIKERIPLPASIGRVCPHPCESACRRGLVDEPVAIANLKRFAADMVMKSNDYIPECAPDTGKKVAVIGGGPYGLSMAFFLREMGHAVTIYEAMPYCGGMIRYGIPEYRLPKVVVESEVDLIREMGVEIIVNTKVGKDIAFDTIRENYDAVCLGIGAWKSTGVRCEGEDLPGVIGGIDFLGKIARNENFIMGKKVAIVGGGNTAMDACRTAVRLGADEVYNIYRRTKDEMPAERIEIQEAEEEGVIFKNLRNPLKIVAGDDGHVASMTLQVMELGEPDASGRRSPKAVEGVTEDLTVDMVILAIGQAVDPAGIDGVELTRKKGIVYDKNTFMTALPGVFAGGDCGNDKISIAVESIADARKGSYVVDSYLSGKAIDYKPEYTVTRTDITEKTFEDRERQCRSEMEELTPEERKSNFLEIAKGYTEEQARTEAKRCLECGCKDYYECKLFSYANQYDVKPERIAGEINKTDFVDDNPYIVRDPNKCILCGLCVRACDEVIGVGALGFVKRGFDTVVLPALGKPLAEAGCISCGQCAGVCPTGALVERMPMSKQIPLQTTETASICGFCSMGCAETIETCGTLAVKAMPKGDGPVNAGVLCKGGKFGFSSALKEDGKLTTAYIRQSGKLVETNDHDAMVVAAKTMQSIARREGVGSVAVAISSRYTTEEAYAISKFADILGAKKFSFDNRACGMEPVLGLISSPNSITEMLSTDVILAVGYEMAGNAVMRIKLMQAAKNGAKVILINPVGSEQAHMSFLYKTVYTENNLAFLKQIAKAVAPDEEAFADVTVTAEAEEIAGLYKNAKKAMIVFQQHIVSVECATLLADIAVLSGHIGSPRNGIVMLKSKNNSEGLTQLGITAGAESLEGVKGLMIFGENPDPELIRGMDFVMVCDTHMTPAAEVADVVIPGTAPIHADGSYINTERRFQQTTAALTTDRKFNWQVAVDMAELLESDLGFTTMDEILIDMETTLDFYREASEGEIIGGVLKPIQTVVIPVKDAPFKDAMPCVDYLKELI